MGLIFPDYGTPFGKPGGQKYSIAGVATAHVALLGLIAITVPADRLAEMARPFTARLIELAPKEPPSPPPPKPAKKAPPVPQPILTAKAVMADAPAPFVVTPQPPAPPALAPIAVATSPTSAPVPVIAARFDADYLDNPKPVYPHASQRLREQGKVVLRVRVTPAGLAERVEIKQSSGFQRLDQAAEDVVGRWRFVPARRGDEAIAAWVLVPISFNLQEG